MGKLLDFLRGSVTVTLPSEHAQKNIALLVEQSIPFRDLHEEDDHIVFTLYPAYYKAYVRLCPPDETHGESHTRHGLLSLLVRHRHRTGHLVGAGLALFLLIFSSFFVWDVTVSGMDRLSEKELLEALEEHGVRLGAFIPSLDTRKIEQELVLSVDGLSWVSLNLRGTVAAVEVRERSTEHDQVSLAAPSNLIAVCDGQIEALEVTGGVAAVRPGQIVKKGELLVSGVIDSNAIGYRLVRARGEVLARVTCSFDVEIPFTEEEKIYSGEVFVQKNVKIFAKNIKLFGKDSISPSSCDKIEKERRLYLFGTIKLPVIITETTYLPYTPKEVTLSTEAVKKKARQTILARVAEALPDATILARHESFAETETGILCHMDVECIRNIAVEVKIETDA